MLFVQAKSFHVIAYCRIIFVPFCNPIGIVVIEDSRSAHCPKRTRRMMQLSKIVQLSRRPGCTHKINLAEAVSTRAQGCCVDQSVSNLGGAVSHKQRCAVDSSVPSDFARGSSMLNLPNPNSKYQANPNSKYQANPNSK